MSGTKTQSRSRSNSIPPVSPPITVVPEKERSRSVSLDHDEWVERVLKVKRKPRARRRAIVLPPPPPVLQRPPQLQQAVEKRLMTFEQLAKKIGHQPHEDKTFKNPFTGKTVTVRKMSTAYKEIEAATGTATRKIAEAGKASLDDFDDEKRREIEGEIVAQLDAARDAAEAYRKKHGKTDTKRDAADAFIKSIDDYKAMLKDGLDAILADPAFESVKGQINLGQALHAKKCGISFADCQFGLYNDSNAQTVNEKFGAGNANSVARIEYKNGDKRVFKRESPVDESQLSIAKNLGIDAQSVHNGNRNIASYAVADLLGVSAVMPKVSYGLHKNPETDEDEIGLLMSLAPGVTPVDPVGNQRRKLWEKDNPPSAKAQASLQQQLNALDWCDGLTGQQDRHAKNYLIDIQGDDVVITGIDNDVAFAPDQTDANVSKQTSIDYAYRTTPPGLPPLIDKPTYERIVAADFDRDLGPKLESLLTAKEVEAAKSRFLQMQSHAQSLSPDYVVDNWETWQSPEGKSSKVFLKEAGNGVGATSSGGLFGRDFAAMFEKDGIL